MNVSFLNPDERRLRAGWRLMVFAALIGLTLLPGTAITDALGSVPYYWRHAVASLTGAGLMLMAAWIQARWVDRRSVADYGLLRGPQWPLHLVFGALLGGALIAGVFAVEWAAGWLRLKPPGARAGQVFSASDLMAQALIYAGIGLRWELAARGCLLRNVAEGLSPARTGSRRAVLLAWLAMILLPAALHATNELATAVSTLFVASFAAFLGLALVWTRSLAIPLGFHLAWKWVQGPVLGFPIDGSNAGQTVLDIAQGGPVLLTGGTSGPEGGLLAVLALAVGAGVLWCWVRWRLGAAVVQENVSAYHPPGAALELGTMKSE